MFESQRRGPQARLSGSIVPSPSRHNRSATRGPSKPLGKINRCRITVCSLAAQVERRTVRRHPAATKNSWFHGFQGTPRHGRLRPGEGALGTIGPMDVLDELAAPVATLLEEVLPVMKDAVSSVAAREGVLPDLYARPLQRGKMLRPLLVLLASRATGGDDGAATMLAAGIELIHLATLVHDDLMDGAPRRRGVPTVHASSGSNAAIVVGDLYLSIGLSCVATALPESAALAASTVGSICVAQQRQEDNVGNADLEVEVYDEIIKGKTGALLSLAARLGARLGTGGWDEDLAQYGEQLGMAFQIADDLLDYCGSAEELGKNPGSDLKSGVITLPLIIALKNDNPSRSMKELVRSYGSLRTGETERILDMVRAPGTVERVNNRVAELSDRAVRHVESLPKSASQEALVRLPGALLNRRR